MSQDCDHPQTRLSNSDQKLVDEYVSSGINKNDRKPFRPWTMMLWLALLIVILGVSARIIGGLFLPY